MRGHDDFRFEANSPVGRYWLIHGVDFTVCREDGRTLGVVEDVVVDPVRLCAEQLIVRRSGLVVRRRRATIDAGAVKAVVPASQVLLLAGPAPRRAKRRSRTGQVLRRLAAGLATGFAAALAVARREAPKLERWVGRSARAAALRLGAAARIAGRVLGEVTVLAAVLVAAVWRRAAPRTQPTVMPPDGHPDASQWPSDADAPLGRETSEEAPTTVGPRRRR